MDEVNTNPIIDVTEQAFESFVGDERNAELVAANKYGIHELVDGSWVTKEIDKVDYVNYKFANISDIPVDDSEEWNALNSTYAAYPFVVLK